MSGSVRTESGELDRGVKGTILLNEVAGMPAELQARLLHLVQDRQFCKLESETRFQPMPEFLWPLL